MQPEGQDRSLSPGRLIWPNMPSGWQQAETRDRRQESMDPRGRAHRTAIKGLIGDSDTRTENLRVLMCPWQRAWEGSAVRQGRLPTAVEKANRTLREVQPGGWEAEGKGVGAPRGGVIAAGRGRQGRDPEAFYARDTEKLRSGWTSQGGMSCRKPGKSRTFPDPLHPDVFFLIGGQMIL